MAPKYDTRQQYIETYKRNHPNVARVPDDQLYSHLASLHGPTLDTLIAENQRAPIRVPEGWVGRMPSRPLSQIDGGEKLLRTASREQRGLAEAMTDWGFKDLPFLGDWYDAGYMGVQINRLRKLQNNQPMSDEELVGLNYYLTMQNRLSDATTMAKVNDVVKGSLKFATEIAGSLATAGTGFFAHGGGKAAHKVATRAGKQALTRYTAALAAKKGVENTAEFAAKAALTRGARRVVQHAQRDAVTGVTTRQLSRWLARNTGRTAATTATDLAAKAMVGGAQAGVLGLGLSLHPGMWGKTASATQRERMAQVMETGDDDLTNALLRGYMDTAIELVSENLGEALVAGAGLARRGLRRVPGGKALDVVEHGKNLAAMLKKHGAGKDLYNRFGAGFVYEALARKGFTGKVQSMNEFLRHAGVGNVIEEMMEERAGDFMRGFLGLEGDEDKWGLINAIKNAIPSWADFKVEAIAFALPGVAMASWQRMVNPPAVKGAVKPTAPSQDLQMSDSPLVVGSRLTDGKLATNQVDHLVAEQERTQKYPSEALAEYRRNLENAHTKADIQAAEAALESRSALRSELQGAQDRTAHRKENDAFVSLGRDYHAHQIVEVAQLFSGADTNTGTGTGTDTGTTPASIAVAEDNNVSPVPDTLAPAPVVRAPEAPVVLAQAEAPAPAPTPVSDPVNTAVPADREAAAGVVAELATGLQGTQEQQQLQEQDQGQQDQGQEQQDPVDEGSLDQTLFTEFGNTLNDMRGEGAAPIENLDRAPTPDIPLKQQIPAAEGGSVLSQDTMTPGRVMNQVKDVQFGWSTESGVHAQIKMDDVNGDVITLFQTAMPVDLVHEISHAWLPLLPIADLQLIADWLRREHHVEIPAESLRDRQVWNTMHGTRGKGGPKESRSALEIVTAAFIFHAGTTRSKKQQARHARVLKTRFGIDQESPMGRAILTLFDRLKALVTNLQAIRRTRSIRESAPVGSDQDALLYYGDKRRQLRFQDTLTEVFDNLLTPADHRGFSAEQYIELDQAAERFHDRTLRVLTTVAEYQRRSSHGRSSANAFIPEKAADEITAMWRTIAISIANRYREHELQVSEKEAYLMDIIQGMGNRGFQMREGTKEDTGAAAAGTYGSWQDMRDQARAAFNRSGEVDPTSRQMFDEMWNRTMARLGIDLEAGDQDAVLPIREAISMWAWIDTNEKLRSDVFFTALHSNTSEEGGATQTVTGVDGNPIDLTSGMSIVAGAPIGPEYIDSLTQRIFADDTRLRHYAHNFSETADGQGPVTPEMIEKFLSYVIRSGAIEVRVASLVDAGIKTKVQKEKGIEPKHPAAIQALLDRDIESEPESDQYQDLAGRAAGKQGDDTARPGAPLDPKPAQKLAADQDAEQAQQARIAELEAQLELARLAEDPDTAADLSAELGDLERAKTPAAVGALLEPAPAPAPEAAKKKTKKATAAEKAAAAEKARADDQRATLMKAAHEQLQTVAEAAYAGNKQAAQQLIELVNMFQAMGADTAGDLMHILHLDLVARIEAVWDNDVRLNKLLKNALNPLHRSVVDAAVEVVKASRDKDADVAPAPDAKAQAEYRHKVSNAIGMLSEAVFRNAVTQADQSYLERDVVKASREAYKNQDVSDSITTFAQFMAELLSTPDPELRAIHRDLIIVDLAARIQTHGTWTKLDADSSLWKENRADILNFAVALYEADHVKEAVRMARAAQRKGRVISPYAPDGVIPVAYSREYDSDDIDPARDYDDADKPALGTSQPPSKSAEGLSPTMQALVDTLPKLTTVSHEASWALFDQLREEVGGNLFEVAATLNRTPMPDASRVMGYGYIAQQAHLEARKASNTQADRVRYDELARQSILTAVEISREGGRAGDAMKFVLRELPGSTLVTVLDSDLATVRKEFLASHPFLKSIWDKGVSIIQGGEKESWTGAEIHDSVDRVVRPPKDRAPVSEQTSRSVSDHLVSQIREHALVRVNAIIDGWFNPTQPDIANSDDAAHFKALISAAAKNFVYQVTDLNSAGKHEAMIQELAQRIENIAGNSTVISGQDSLARAREVYEAVRAEAANDLKTFAAMFNLDVTKLADDINQAPIQTTVTDILANVGEHGAITGIIGAARRDRQELAQELGPDVELTESMHTAAMILADKLGALPQEQGPRDRFKDEMVRLLLGAMRKRLAPKTPNTKYSVFELIELAVNDQEAGNIILQEALQEVMIRYDLTPDMIAAADREDMLNNDAISEEAKAVLMGLWDVMEMYGMELNLIEGSTTRFETAFLPNRTLEKAIQEVTKRMETRMDRLTKEPLTVQRRTVAELAAEVMNLAAVPLEDAWSVAERLHEIAVDKLTRAKIQKLNTALQARPEVEEEAGKWTRRMLELIWSGALDADIGSEEQRNIWLSEFGRRFRVPVMVTEVRDELKRYAREVDEAIANALPLHQAEGLSQTEAMRRYLTSSHHRGLIAKMHTVVQQSQNIPLKDMVSALFYFNALSAFSTQELNFIGTLTQAMATLLNTTRAHRNADRWGMADEQINVSYAEVFRQAGKGLWTGLRQMFPHIVRTDSIIGANIVTEQDLGKDVQPTFELNPFAQKFGGTSLDFLKHLDNAKFLRRIMVANDYAFARGAAQAHLYMKLLQEAQMAGWNEAQTQMWMALNLWGDRQRDVTSPADRAQLEAEIDQMDFADPLVMDKFKARFKEVDLAHREAARVGLTPGTFEYQMRVEEILFQALPANWRSDIAMIAGRSTYNMRSDDTIYDGRVITDIGNLAMHAKQGDSAVNFMARFVFPFVSIVTKVFNTSSDYMLPVGMYHLHHMRKEIAKGDQAKTQFREVDLLYLRSQLAWGNTFFVGLGVLAALAYGMDPDDPWIDVTSAGPKDRAMRNQLRETGYQEYTMKIGGTRWNYQMSPLAIPLALIGSYMDGIRYDQQSGESAAAVVGASTLRAIPAMLDQTFLTSAFDLAGVMSNPNETNFIKFIARTGSTFVVPNMAKQLTRMVSPTLRDPESWPQEFLQEMPAPFSFLAGRPRLNALGEEVKLGASSIATTAPQAILSGNRIGRIGRLVNFNPNPHDRVWNFLAAKKVRVPAPTRNMTLDGVPMNGREFYEYSQVRGAALRTWITHRLDAGAYEALSSEEIQADVTAMSRRLTNIVKAAMVTGQWDKIPTAPSVQVVRAQVEREG
jgi:hypothetical protein